MSEVDLMNLGALIVLSDKLLLSDMARVVATKWPTPTIVNIGVLLGASCGCLRTGAPHCKLYGVDVNDFGPEYEDVRAALDMTFLVGDSRVIHDQFNEPIHLIFVDGDHSEATVTADIENWVLPHVVPGGYALFHDAYYPPGHPFEKTAVGVAASIDALLCPNEWVELERKESIRWFIRN